MKETSSMQGVDKFLQPEENRSVGRPIRWWSGNIKTDNNGFHL